MLIESIQSYAKISNSGDFYALANCGFAFTVCRARRNQHIKNHFPSQFAGHSLSSNIFHLLGGRRQQRNNEELAIRLMAFIDSP